MTELNAERTGAFLAALRKARGYTQQEAAELLNVSNKTVSKWESGGGFPEIGVLPSLAELYGVTVDEILAGRRLQQDSPEPPQKQEARKNRLLHRAVTQCGVFWAPGLLLVLLSGLLGYQKVWGLLALTAGCALMASGWIWALAPLWQPELELPENGLAQLWRRISYMGLVFALAVLCCGGAMLRSRNSSMVYYSPVAMLLYGGSGFLCLSVFQVIFSAVRRRYETRWGAPLLAARPGKLTKAALYVLLTCEGLILICFVLSYLWWNYSGLQFLKLGASLLRLIVWVAAGVLGALALRGGKKS